MIHVLGKKYKIHVVEVVSFRFRMQNILLKCYFPIPQREYSHAYYYVIIIIIIIIIWLFLPLPTRID